MVFMPFLLSVFHVSENPQMRLTESLHQRSISQADGCIAQRIDARLRLIARGTSWLVRRSYDLKALASDGVDEVWSLDGERGDGSRELGA